MRRHVILLIITVVVIVGTFVGDPALEQPARARPRPPGRHLDRALPGEGLRPDALNTAVDVIRNRVDGLGIAEPDVQRQGNTIVVNLPGREGPGQGREPRRPDRRAAVPAGPVLRQHPLQFPYAATSTTPPRRRARRPRRSRARRPPRRRARRARPAPAANPSHDGRHGTRRPPAGTRRARARSPRRRSSPGSPRDADRARRRRDSPDDASTARRRRPGGAGHDGRRHHAHHDPAARPPPRRRRSRAARRSIKQSPHRHRQRASRSCCPIANTSRATCSARRSSPARASARPSTLYDSTQSQWSTNVHFKNNDFVNKIAGPLRRQAGRDRARRRRAVGAEINAGHHRPGRRDHRQLHAGRGATSSRSCCGTARCRCSSTSRSRRSRACRRRSARTSSPPASSSGLIGLALVALYMFFFYRLLGLVVMVGLGLTGMLFFAARVVPVERARPHAHAGRGHRHHRVGRCDRRLVCRLFRATQRRGAHGQDRALLARARLPCGRSARSSPPTSCR